MAVWKPKQVSLLNSPSWCLSGWPAHAQSPWHPWGSAESPQLTQGPAAPLSLCPSALLGAVAHPHCQWPGGLVALHSCPPIPWHCLQGWHSPCLAAQGAAAPCLPPWAPLCSASHPPAPWALQLARCKMLLVLYCDLNCELSRLLFFGTKPPFPTSEVKSQIYHSVGLFPQKGSLCSRLCTL